MNEDKYISDEIAWAKSLRGQDFGRKILKTMEYGEAKNLLEPLITGRLKQKRRLDTTYNKLASRIARYYAPDTADYDVTLTLCWAVTRAKEDTNNTARLDELIRYWRFNETRKPTFQPPRGYHSFNLLIERAKECPIESLYTGRLRANGSRLSGSCPFHEEKTPSFFIFTDTNRYHCFGCQAHGDAINFYQHLTGLDFKEVIEKLAPMS